MQTFRRILLSTGFIVLSLAFAHQTSAAENPGLSPEKLADIKASCVNVQVILQKIQYNDAATRVNRGQGYENLMTRMMIPMNSRTAINGFNSSAAELADITTRYQQVFSTFKNNYENYDDALADALRVKCQQEPADFYNSLTEARQQRVNLSSDIATLSQLIEEYRQAVIKLKAEL